MGKSVTPGEGNLKTFDYGSVPAIGVVDLGMAIGPNNVTHRWVVVEPKQAKAIVILGRDFMRRFGRTVFEWDNQRIQLGEEWFSPTVWLRGGDIDSRVSVMNASDKEFDFDINPDLPEHQRSQLKSLLDEFSDCFAADPKRPTLTNLGEHVIETVSGARPVKSKKIVFHHAKSRR